MPKKVRKGSINLTKIMTWEQTCRSWFSPRSVELGGVVLFVVLWVVIFFSPTEVDLPCFRCTSKKHLIFEKKKNIK